MFSLFSTWFGNAERDKEMKRELMERETQFLDCQLREEENKLRRHGHQSSAMESLMSTKNRSEEQDVDINQNKDRCLSQKGIITRLTGIDGAIDTYIHFDSKVAGDVFQELRIGSVVEYLTFQNNLDDVPRVVKVQRIVEDVWDEDEVSKDRIEEAVEKLKIEQATAFKTQTRNVMGLITARLQSSIEVDTEYGQLEVDIDSVETTFVPQEGDRVRLECNVQLDDDFVDKQGEILEVKKVLPQRIEPDQKCAVESVYENLSLLGKSTYVLRSDFPAGNNLHMGDLVRADLIECQYSTFTKRAIRVTLMEKNFGELKLKTTISPGAVNECQSVSVFGSTRYITTELQKRDLISLKVRNNMNSILTLKGVNVPNGGASQLSVVEPTESVDIPIASEISLVFEVYTKFMGETSEIYYLDLGHFKIRRCIAVIVAKTEEEALAAEKRMSAVDVLLAPGRTVLQRSRYYANQVWSSPRDVVPGQSITTKRRFVAVRLEVFDVPEKLRQIYLTTERKIDMFEAIEALYPCSKDLLSAQNYVQILSLFLHLEEIEYFVLMRNYDMVRAHFLREGEYLSLMIENLAERRPSLVIGDVVRAINPWEDSNKNESNNKSYEGIIHKVLFNRVLLKFNASFQGKYNGEDYRLEFHFSRFGLRKQHHAISNILSTLGADFLFPSKVSKREQPQLEVRMENEDDMYLYDTQIKWYNPLLNRIQKRAVFNIMRGETLNMPYVIFGPPGTGKTITLVEVLLQLAENVPGARILVGTPSNSSADLITRRVIESKVLPQGDFIRLVSYNQIEKELIPQDLMSYCATVDIGSSGSCADNMIITESGLRLRCQVKFIGRHRVTIGTNATLGNFMQMDFPKGHFTHVLIDEAGQCTEPETMVPISMLVRNKCQVILAGDPRQLQAVVVNRFSTNSEFSKSFLERLLDRTPYKKDLQRFPNFSGYNPLCLTKLLNNYRALPTIMCTYSKLFYDDELIAMVSETDSREIRLLQKAKVIFKDVVADIPTKQAAFFFGIDGKNMQESDSPSWYNPLEAKEVFLTTIALYRANIHHDQIGILTPYAKQVKTIRSLFIGTDVTMPKIGSVEEFQGQERDIMLISTVRSSQTLVRSDSQMSLGFVKSSKRMNVAISRGRAMMVVFGNPNLLAMDESWSRYITYCAHNNAVFGCELPDAIVHGSNEEQEEKKCYKC